MNRPTSSADGKDPARNSGAVREFELTARHLPLPQVFLVVAAACTAGAMANILPFTAISAWFLGVSGLAVTQVALPYTAGKADRHGEFPKYRRVCAYLSATLWGAAWGIPGAWCLIHLPLAYAPLILAALGLACTASAIVYLAYFSVAATAITVCTAPVLFALAHENLVPFRSLNALVALYAGLMLFFAQYCGRELQRAQRRIRESQTLREQLRRELDDTERVSQEKLFFLASASHDLRQPLRSLALYVGLLNEQSDLSAMSRKLVAKIDRVVTTMGHLFDYLLGLARLETDLAMPYREHFPVSGLLDEVKRDFSTEAAAKTLTLRVSPTSMVAFSDRAGVGNILRNLVDNAIHHTRTGGVLLGCRHCDTGIRVEVWDTGPGISPAELERIFQPFHQAAPAAHHRKPGVGLGLTIAKRTADSLGHRLTVKSFPGRGSVFSLELPKGDAAGVRDEHATSSAAQAPCELVLLINDSKDVRTALNLLLSAYGYRVLNATSMSEMLGVVLNCPGKPALIISDHRLKNGETGIDIVERLREEYNDDTLPAIILLDASQAHEIGQVTARRLLPLSKPLNAEHLRKVINEALSM